MSTQPAWHLPQWTLGDRLRKAREDAGLSQDELARIIHVSRSTIGNAEVGARTPLPITQAAWADATSVPLEWIETGSVPPARHPVGRRPQSRRKPNDTELMQKRYHKAGVRHMPNPGYSLKVPA